uniref:F-box and leucine-rich repeat protein 13 isoform X2 n=1 Tax=Pristiophorus japonicus TaxID=55135 RepID=UPI00398EA77B
MSFADPEMKNYIKLHSLPEIYEALLTGLFVQCPDDPLIFLEEKIKELLNQKKDQALLLTKESHLNLSWDMFINAESRQSMNKMIGSYLSYLFDLESGEVLAPELYEKAYWFYSNFLLKKCFRLWQAYLRNGRMQQMKMLQNLLKASNKYVQARLKMAFNAWLQWMWIRKQQQALAIKHLQQVNNQLLLRAILREWNTVAKESGSTREYFERLERGELDDENDIQLVTMEEMKDHISQLPWATALKIFNHLGVQELARCAQVCQSWKVLTQTSSLWSKMNFYPLRKWIEDNNIAYILRNYRPSVIHLNLRGCSNISWATFKGISDCRNLQDLNLSECANLTDEFVSLVLEMCTSLLYLNLAYTAISDGTLRSLSTFSLNLQYLSLAYSKNFTNKGLHYLASGKGCHKLTYLDISGCTQFMVSYDYNLTTISLLATPHISDTAIKTLVQGKRITTVKIEGNKHIGDLSFKFFSNACPNLNHIYVSDCPRITDSSLKAISTLKNIIVFNISDCISITDVGVRYLAEGSSGSKLRELNLSNCMYITDLSMLKIVQKCSNLTHLRLRYCLRLTDSGIEWLKGLPALTNIDLTGDNIHEQSLSGLGKNSKLREFTVAECPGVNDNGLQKFYHKMVDLEYLDISHCLSVSDQSIKTLAFCCRRLISLNIAGCPQITDFSIKYLAGVCHYIYFLDISGCINLTDSIFTFLKKGCKNLRILKMLYCIKITKQAVKAVNNIQQLEYSDEIPPIWFGYDNQENLLVTNKEEDENTQQA